jgi:hypothetical protein
VFGRKSRSELAAEVEEQRERLKAFEAARRGPLWRRALGRARGLPWWLALVVVPATALGLGVVAGTILAARATAWGWRVGRAYPRPATATLLTGWAAAGGPGGWWWGVLPLSLTTAAATWWHHVTTRPAPVVTVVAPHDYVTAWRERVAGGSGDKDAPAPGSHVSDLPSVVRTPDGRPCGVVLHVTGADSTQTPVFMRRITDRLAFVYAVDQSAITVRAVKGNNRRADVEILDQWWIDEQAQARADRIHVVQPWAGPALADNGRFRVMTVAMDGRPGDGQLWVPDGGARPIDISGLQGSGKSNTVNVVNASILSRGLVVMDLVDLKGGASVPAWRQTAYRFGADVDDALLALLRWCVVTDVRTAAMARMPVLAPDGTPVLDNTGAPAYGVTVLEPSRERPVYVLEIDEFPQVARLKVAQPLIKRGLEQGRAALCTLASVHQGTATRDGYVDGDALTRGLATNGTVIAHRGDEAATARVLSRGSTLRVDGISKGTPGVAALQSDAEPREVLGRVEYLADPWEAARHAIPGTLEEPAATWVDRLDAHVAEFGGLAELARVYAVGFLPALERAMTARETARDAAVYAAASGSVGMVPGVSQPATTTGATTGGVDVDPSAGNRIVAFLAAQGPGQVFTTGALLAGADVYSSTFTAWRRRQADGVLVDHGRGKWAAGPALHQTTGSRA